MKKFLLLLIIILFAVIISCESKVDILKDYDGDWINLVENGEFIFTAIRSDDTNDANDTAALVKLRRTLSEKTGIELKVGNDWVKRGEDPPTDTYEILIGLTNRPESIAARQKLGMRDFFIGFYGNRIVIVAGESASVVDAVEFFLENFCNKGENISVPENYEYLHKFDYKITELLLVGEDISSYVIAYTNTEAKTGADRFAYDIGYYTGKRISVINANQASGRMIVFDSGTAFSIKGKDNNLYISGGNELELIYAYEAFLVNYLEGSKISIDVNNVSIDSYTAQNMNKFLTYTAFETKYMRLNIALNGHVLGLYDKASGENYANKGAPTYIVAINKSGVKTPTEANFNDGTAVFTFDEETSLRFKYEISDDYFTLELLDDLGDNVTSVNFFNFNLTRIDEDFMVTLYSMAFQTNPNVYPDGKTTALGGTAYSKFHPKGSKLALIAGPKSEHRTLLKAANQVIDRTKVGYSDIGGANAMDHPGNYGDYIIVSDSSRSAINGYIELSKKYGIDQIDFHYGASTFLNGSFEFIGYNSSAEFKTNVTDKLKEAGIVSGLHTYAHYIVPGDALLLDPKWQQQLGVLSTMTLTEDLSSSDLKLYVDDSSKVTPSVSWFSRNSRYLLIDEEIVSISTYGDNEFIVSRGCGGTKRAEHKAGATVKHLDGVFDLIAPDPNSELFLQVARNTAKAFNEGGFGMIYLDAIDGMGAHVPHDEVWYYNAKFINEILQNCEKSPIIEYSAMFPSMWISRTRMGAWDHPNIGYKEWNRRHVDSNMYYYDMHYPTTLGWYHFAPPVDNTNGKYKFFDDIDYMGSLAIAYNMGIVYIPVAPANQMY
ncbi:MAG: hypothetical protein FWF15_06875, partial [Oscillospiraceae bacterium]|nr:hypothetical protein [Oscillospiraceae bacterium]